MRFPTLQQLIARLPTSDQVIAQLRERPRVLVGTVVALSLIIWVAFGASVGYVYSAVTGAPASHVVRTAGSMARSTTIVDVKGRHAFTIFQEQRLHVPLAKMSPHLVQAILASEDRRFYEHGGVDVIRVVGAGVNNLLEGEVEQGGSTITQQLARLTFLTPDKTYRRKLQEVVVAARLESAFTKDEILELYLNKAYFGDGLYGAEAAALGYFGKHAKDLDLSESALIAGLVKSPSSYAPTASAERAIARRNVVLRSMFETGVIRQKEYDTARNRKLSLNDALRREEAYGQYFKEEVRKQLVEWFGWDRVHHEGLRVETTIDLDMQKAAEAEVARALDEIEKRQGRRARQSAEKLQAALVSLDPRTGEVRAMVGGRGFTESRFNRVTQAKRQPGSAFKPFMYAAALESGFTPATMLRNLSDPIMTSQGAWIPSDGHAEQNELTMRAALRMSSNRAAVRMIEGVGIPATVEYADRFGMHAMPQVPSLALGSGEVTMLSLVSAYGAFANGGTLVEPLYIKRVTTSSGEVLYESTPVAHEVVTPATAFMVTSMLEDVVDAGTGSQVRRMGFGLPAAGKTGTTNDYRDAWFVGYTPRLVTGVWVGYDQPRTIIPDGYAAQLAVPMWTRFMTTATKGHRADRFDAPGGVVAATICPISGKLATDSCYRNQANVFTEFFAQGTEPTEICPFHIIHSGVPVTLAAASAPPGQVPLAAGRTIIASSAPATGSPAGDSAATAPQQEPEKKRGFWSRVFGRK